MGVLTVVPRVVLKADLTVEWTADWKVGLKAYQTADLKAGY